MHVWVRGFFSDGMVVGDVGERLASDGRDCCMPEGCRSMTRALDGDTGRFSSDPVFSESDLSWLDECNSFRCVVCGRIAALGYMVCPRCGGALKGVTIAEPPAPRNLMLEPDNGFQCYACGLTWGQGAFGDCPACGGILLPVRIEDRLL